MRDAAAHERAIVNGGMSEALLEALFANAPLGIGFFDRAFRFVRVNAALAELNGIPAEAHVGKTPRELLPGLPIDDIEAAWRRVLETGVPLTNMEISGETPSMPGVRRHWREDWYPVVVNGEVVGLAAIVREVTEQKRLDEVYRTLLGIVGHDIRNPLSVVLNAAALLLAGEDVNERQATLAVRIRRAANRIDVLARTLLDYTAVQRGGGLPVAPRPTHLDEVIAAAADEVQASYPAAVIRRVGDGDPHGVWDAERLQQLVGNLLSNAAKYGAPGEPILAVWTGEPDAVTIQVRNAGAPIPPERLAQLFDAGTQGPEHDPQGGIGLGLFIAREIVRAHAGSIEAASSEAETTFTVRLPRDAPRRG